MRKSLTATHRVDRGDVPKRIVDGASPQSVVRAVEQQQQQQQQQLVPFSAAFVRARSTCASPRQ